MIINYMKMINISIPYYISRKKEIRKAIDLIQEEIAVQDVLRAKKEPDVKGDLDELAKKYRKSTS